MKREPEGTRVLVKNLSSFLLASTASALFCFGASLNFKRADPGLRGLSQCVFKCGPETRREFVRIENS